MIFVSIVISFPCKPVSQKIKKCVKTFQILQKHKTFLRLSVLSCLFILPSLFIPLLLVIWSFMEHPVYSYVVLPSIIISSYNLGHNRNISNIFDYEIKIFSAIVKHCECHSHVTDTKPHCNSIQHMLQTYIYMYNIFI